MHCSQLAELVRPADLLHAARYLRLDRRCHVSSHLRRQAAHLLSLGPERAELLAPEGSLQFHCLGNILGPVKVLRKFKAGIDVLLGNVDNLTVERHSALTSRVKGFLPTR